MPAQKKSVKILALESSADETSAAILFGDARTKTFVLKSNLVHSQIAIHQKTGGIVPENAARAHLPKILGVVTLALKQAKTTLPEIDAVAVTAGPGLVTSLMIGVDTAKAFAFALQKPMIPINHMEGHLLSALAGARNFKSIRRRGQKSNFRSLFPALGLTVSGGHTMLVLIKKIGEYQILGQTVDDAAGEAFDKIAKILDLPYPGGPEISKLAKQGDPKAFELPRPMLKHQNFNFSFAGLKTSVLYLWQDLKKTNRRRADLAASAQAAIVDVLVQKTLRAAKSCQVKTVLLGGGVSANRSLRETLKKHLARETSAKFLMPDFALSTDNAGMIAAAAWFHYLSGSVAGFANIRVNPNWALASWRKK